MKYLFVIAALFAFSGLALAQIPPCGCGCVTTGQCECKNCNTHTADPAWVAQQKLPVTPVAAVPTAPPVTQTFVIAKQHQGIFARIAAHRAAKHHPVQLAPTTTTMSFSVTGSSSPCVNGVCPIPKK